MKLQVSWLSWPSLLIGLTCGLLVIPLWDAAAPASREESARETFREAFELTHDRYVDQGQTDPTELVYDAIQGMVEGLGDTGHSRFLTPEQRRREEQHLAGEFVGIGIEMVERDGRAVVVAAIPGSPAARAGIRSGDRILKVDGEDVANLGLSDLGQRIRGPVGTTVRLTVLHTDDTVEELSVRRETIHVPAVAWAPLADSSLWHIHISQFAEGASEELDRALAAAREAGATGIVLDLRDNPGGLLDEAVEVVSRFVDEGVVLIERDRDGDLMPVRVKDRPATVELPLTVLVNGGSASASEIVSAALLHHGRAPVIGTTTFGTGTVLHTFELPDGSALKLGVREWLTPSGEPLRGQGVTPTQVVPLPTDVTPLIPERPSSETEHVCSSRDSQLRVAAVRLGLTCAPA